MEEKSVMEKGVEAMIIGLLSLGTIVAIVGCIVIQRKINAIKKRDRVTDLNETHFND